MATPIIAAIRQRRDLKESLTHTAQELAHLSSLYGVVRVSYSYLALKCHCSRRTVIRHIQRLIDAGIVRKSVLWIRGNCCEINTYTFRIPWHTSRPTRGSDKTSSTLPRQEREKHSAVREELARQKKGIQFLTQGSDQWQKVCEEIARLEGLLAPDVDVGVTETCTCSEDARGNLTTSETACAASAQRRTEQARGRCHALRCAGWA